MSVIQQAQLMIDSVKLSNISNNYQLLDIFGSYYSVFISGPTFAFLQILVATSIVKVSDYSDTFHSISCDTMYVCLSHRLHEEILRQWGELAVSNLQNIRQFCYEIHYLGRTTFH